MTDLVERRAAALARCTLMPGGWDKRFARSVAAIASTGQPLTEKQAANVDRLAWKYRRQMPADLVPEQPE